MGDLDTFIVNVFAGVRGRLAPAFAGGAGGGSPLLHGMDHGLWSMVHFPWSMVHGPFWPSFSRKNRPEHCFLQYIGANFRSQLCLFSSIKTFTAFIETPRV